MLAHPVQNYLGRYGDWAVVTGASDGIGRAMARDLAARGFNLVLVARRNDALQDLGRELSQRHAVSCVAIASDLGTAEGRRAVIEGTEGLDIGLLVAAAGFGTSGDFVGNPLEPERQMLAVNCDAVLELTWHYARRFVARGRGGIVLMSSVLAFQGAPRSAHYAATKAWVQTFAEGLRVELRPHGVDVLASAPGPVASGFATLADMRMGPMLRADDVARVTLAALGRAGTVRPGWLSKLMGWSLAALPRWARVKVLARVVGAMTAHRTSAESDASPPSSQQPRARG
jgi:short-subunit dehydrogenase